MQADHEPIMKRDSSPAECDSSTVKRDYPLCLKHDDTSSMKRKSSPHLKRDGSPSIFNPVSESMVEVEETSGRDTNSNLDAVLTLHIPHSSQHNAQLKLGSSLEKPTSTPDPPCTFFDPKLRSERLTYFKITALSTLMTALALSGILSIYWGAMWNMDQNAHKLRGIVVDFDQDAIGKAVLQAAREQTGSPRQITWMMSDSSEFNNDNSKVAQAVLDEKYWAAIVVQPGSTQRLRQAINSTNNAYDSTSAVTIYVSPARQELAYSHFIQPQFSDVLKSAKISFGKQHAKFLSQTPDFNLIKVMENAPQTISNPLDFRVNELTTFDVPIVSAMTAIGLIYVTLAALISCNNASQTRTQLIMREKLKLVSLIQLRISSPLISYLCISLSYTLLSVLFHAPFGRFRGHNGFILCWLMFFLGMSALGLTIEVVTSILTPQYIPYFLIFWVIWNISVCYLPIDVLPTVYRYAYLSPFYNVNRTIRAIVLGTKNDLVINFSVQLSWITISSINITLCEIWRWRKTKILRNRDLDFS